MAQKWIVALLNMNYIHPAVSATMTKDKGVGPTTAPLLSRRRDLPIGKRFRFTIR